MRPPTPSHLTRLAGKTDRWFQRAKTALLSQVPCHAGCAHCCIGVFPITRLDVRLLQEGLAQLPAEQQHGIAERAAQQVAALETAYPQLKSSDSLNSWSDTDIDEVVSTFANAPCPALDESGLCSVYAHRPLTCRSMGIPSRQNGTVYGACDVQTFVPIVRLSASLETEEQELANQEAAELAKLPEVAEGGEELFLPYGLLSSKPNAGGDTAAPSSEHGDHDAVLQDEGFAHASRPSRRATI